MSDIVNDILDDILMFSPVLARFLVDVSWFDTWSFVFIFSIFDDLTRL